jgi:hypothetical protein
LRQPEQQNMHHMPVSFVSGTSINHVGSYSIDKI